MCGCNNLLHIGSFSCRPDGRGFFPVLGFHVNLVLCAFFDLITSLHLNFLCHCVCLCSIVATLPRNREINSNNWYQSPRLLGSGLNKLYGKDGEIRY